jgi:hydroxymethylpyrimidine kinase / phosphomethylpyrimidine kinase / thiamine-phosphate diphosphorylase
MDAVLEDVHISAAKTGMLYSAEIATAVADRLTSTDFPLVVDPVLVAGVGDALGRDGLVEAIREKIAPLATIISPNVPEAEALAGLSISTDDDVRKACRALSRLGAEAVLLKGGHLDGDMSVDTFYHQGKFLRLGSPRVEARGHGGGCILSSYLTANLAKGQGMWEAFLAARAAIVESIARRFPVGRGVPVVDPMGRVIKDAHRYQVSMRLRASAKRAGSILPKSWVPATGATMVFGLPGATDVQDVCGMDIPVRNQDGEHCPIFGGPPRLATAVLAAMKHDGRLRAGMSLRCTETVVMRARRAGLTVGTFRRRISTGDVAGYEKEGMEDLINVLGCVPDIVSDRGGPGMEPLVRVLASSPEELVSRIERALQ